MNKNFIEKKAKRYLVLLDQFNWDQELTFDYMLSESTEKDIEILQTILKTWLRNLKSNKFKK